MSIPRTLYYVDDNRDDLEVFGLAAENLNVSIHFFSEAVKLLAELENDVKPDIIFTDMNMSTISGLELISIIRGNNISIPIVVLTTSHNNVNIVKALEAGADYYITKPASLKRLRAAIEYTIGVNWNEKRSADVFLHKFN